MANDIEARITDEQTARTYADAPMAMRAVAPDGASAEKRSFVKDAAKGLGHVAKVIWQVPAARGALATLLVRFGLPGSLVAIGMAVGEKLAQ